MRLIPCALLLLATSAAFAKTESKDFDAKYVKSFVIENMQGDISITGVTTPRALVVADEVKFPEDCILDVKQEGTEITAKVDQKSFMRKGDCKVNFTISVPPNTNLEIKLGSGNLTILNAQGKIQYKVGNGDVNVDGDIADIDGKIGSGKTTVSGLKGKASFFAGSGTHKITYAKVPSKGELEIKTGAGATDVLLPADSKFALDAKIGAGSVHNEIGETKSAKFKITYKAGTGDLNINKN